METKRIKSKRIKSKRIKSKRKSQRIKSQRIKSKRIKSKRIKSQSFKGGDLFRVSRGPYPCCEQIKPFRPLEVDPVTNEKYSSNNTNAVWSKGGLHKTKSKYIYWCSLPQQHKHPDILKTFKIMQTQLKILDMVSLQACACVGHWGPNSRDKKGDFFSWNPERSPSSRNCIGGRKIKLDENSSFYDKWIKWGTNTEDGDEYKKASLLGNQWEFPGSIQDEQWVNAQSLNDNYSDWDSRMYKFTSNTDYWRGEWDFGTKAIDWSHYTSKNIINPRWGDMKVDGVKLPNNITEYRNMPLFWNISIPDGESGDNNAWNSILAIYIINILMLKRPMVIHCWGGWGRTGSVIALFSLIYNIAQDHSIIDTISSTKTFSEMVKIIKRNHEIFISEGEVNIDGLIKGIPGAASNQIRELYYLNENLIKRINHMLRCIYLFCIIVLNEYPKIPFFNLDRRYVGDINLGNTYNNYIRIVRRQSNILYLSNKEDYLNLPTSHDNLKKYFNLIEGIQESSWYGPSFGQAAAAATGAAAYAGAALAAGTTVAAAPALAAAGLAGLTAKMAGYGGGDI